MRRGLGVLAIGWMGCGTEALTEPPKAPESPVIVLDELHITRTDPATLGPVFEEATAQMMERDYASAAKNFARIAEVEPKSERGADSAFNAALAHAELGDVRSAIVWFERARATDFPIAKAASIRLLRAYGYAVRWSELLSVSEATLKRTDLPVMERIEAQGARSLALVSLGRVDEAYDAIVAARNLIEDQGMSMTGPSFELAQVNFALGEVRKAKSERIRFQPTPDDFAGVLEDRCTGLLDAQSAYADSMRSLDAHWSAMAGFRVGQLYQNLHRDVIVVAPPAMATSLRQKQLWEGAMRLRYRVLLEKGLRMMEGTVSLGERTGESSPWIARAREASRELASALAAEKEALSRMPFTEAEIQAALDDLKARPKP